MKTPIAVALLAALCAGPVLAGTGNDEIRALAQEAGITERQMRMLNGPSTAYAEYRTSYGYLRHQMRRRALIEAREDAIRIEAEAQRADADEAETYALPED